MASRKGSDNEAETASSMSFVFYLQTLLPQPSSHDPLVIHLNSRFPVKLIAVIPNKLGRIQRTQSHRSEYYSLVSNLPQTQTTSFLPSIKQAYKFKIQRFNQVNHHRIHYRTPGIIRVTPKQGRISRLSPVSSRSPLSLTRSFRVDSPMKTHMPKRVSELPTLESYEGDYLNGQKHGSGTAHFPNGDKYKGQWSDGTKHGHGVYRYKQLGLKYRGDWHQDKRHGEGTLIFRNGDSVSGIWEEGSLTQNRSSLTYKNSQIYEGELEDCERSGVGIQHYSDSVIFKGEWGSDQRHGMGVILGDNYFYEGHFSQDTTESPGVLVHKCGIIDTSNPGSMVPIVDFTMHDGFNDQFDMFNDHELTGNDIIYMAISVSELMKTCDLPSGTVLKDGLFLAGKLNGCGMARYGKFGEYIGNFMNGRRSGWGKMTYNDPSYICLWANESEGEYKGQWLNDQRQGYGQMTWSNGIRYEGNFNKDKRHQVTGTMWFVTGEVYSGGWVENMMEGHGCLTSASGTSFAGQFFKGKAMGRGTLEFNDGRVYKGEISMFEPHGKGRMEFPIDEVYEGDFVRGVFFGSGKIVYRNGDQYEGEWEAGARNGYGVFNVRRTGQRYEGEWRGNKREGSGRLIDGRGNVIYDGRWANDIRDV